MGFIEALMAGFGMGGQVGQQRNLRWDQKQAETARADAEKEAEMQDQTILDILMAQVMGEVMGTGTPGMGAGQAVAAGAGQVQDVMTGAKPTVPTAPDIAAGGGGDRTLTAAGEALLGADLGLSDTLMVLQHLEGTGGLYEEMEEAEDVDMNEMAMAIQFMRGDPRAEYTSRDILDFGESMGVDLSQEVEAYPESAGMYDVMLPAPQEPSGGYSHGLRLGQHVMDGTMSMADIRADLFVEGMDEAYRNEAMQGFRDAMGFRDPTTAYRGGGGGGGGGGGAGGELTQEQFVQQQRDLLALETLIRSDLEGHGIYGAEQMPPSDLSRVVQLRAELMLYDRQTMTGPVQPIPEPSAPGEEEYRPLTVTEAQEAGQLYAMRWNVGEIGELVNEDGERIEYGPDDIRMVMRGYLSQSGLSIDDINAIADQVAYWVPVQGG